MQGLMVTNLHWKNACKLCLMCSANARCSCCCLLFIQRKRIKAVLCDLCSRKWGNANVQRMTLVNAMHPPIIKCQIISVFLLGIFLFIPFLQKVLAYNLIRRLRLLYITSYYFVIDLPYFALKYRIYGHWVKIKPSAKDSFLFHVILKLFKNWTFRFQETENSACKICFTPLPACSQMLSTSRL